ncbi:hypothetical protein [Rhizobium sp. RCC_161_2]|uniref:hypothetical protein n=1 Tax=Rhizobium sp. RCC_161_2 TaxID=3239219 RepID=UPI00352658B7
MPGKDPKIRPDNSQQFVAVLASLDCGNHQAVERLHLRRRLKQRSHVACQRSGDVPDFVETRHAAVFRLPMIFRRGCKSRRDRTGRGAANIAKPVACRDLRDRMGIDHTGGDPAFHDQVTLFHHHPSAVSIPTEIGSDRRY